MPENIFSKCIQTLNFFSEVGLETSPFQILLAFEAILFLAISLTTAYKDTRFRFFFHYLTHYFPIRPLITSITASGSLVENTNSLNLPFFNASTTHELPSTLYTSRSLPLTRPMRIP